jgi:hypothetical protein
MKRSLLSFVLCLGFMGTASGQGTLQFQWDFQGHVLYDMTDYTVTGYGTLTLNRGVLTYNLFVPNLRNYPVETHFHADATDMIVSLAPYTKVPPGPGWPGGITYSGQQIVSTSLPELLAGEWYVQLHSPDYENGRMRGYIQPVPEPSALALAATTLCGAMFFRWLKSLAAFRRRQAYS